ncbi:MAG: hypothetical protein HY686_07035 [Chloroflexi bacterium]|nr:hypothetical protein [Chloroflexota bacterium]
MHQPHTTLATGCSTSRALGGAPPRHPRTSGSVRGAPDLALLGPGVVLRGGNAINIMPPL